VVSAVSKIIYSRRSIAQSVDVVGTLCWAVTLRIYVLFSLWMVGWVLYIASIRVTYMAEQRIMNKWEEEYTVAYI